MTPLTKDVILEGCKNRYTVNDNINGLINIVSLKDGNIVKKTKTVRKAVNWVFVKVKEELEQEQLNFENN